MLSIRPNARTTPATCAEIACSSEPSGVPAQRYGISAEAIRKWRKRGSASTILPVLTVCPGRPPRTSAPWSAPCGRAPNFARDDLTFVVRHFLPHLNRAGCLAHPQGLNRRHLPVSTKLVRGKGTFRDYDLGFIHIDIKHLPKLQTTDRERRKRYLFVAIDRRSSRFIWRSRTMRPRRAPLPSCAKPRPLSRSGSPTC